MNYDRIVVVTTPQYFKKDLDSCKALLDKNGFVSEIKKVKRGRFTLIREAVAGDPDGIGGIVEPVNSFGIGG